MLLLAADPPLEDDPTLAVAVELSAELAVASPLPAAVVVVVELSVLSVVELAVVPPLAAISA